jgi:hypothetical protein
MFLPPQLLFVRIVEACLVVLFVFVHIVFTPHIPLRTAKQDIMGAAHAYDHAYDAARDGNVEEVKKFSKKQLGKTDEVNNVGAFNFFGMCFV